VCPLGWYLVEGLLEFLVEDHVKQPQPVQIPISLPLSISRNLAQFPSLNSQNKTANKRSLPIIQFESCHV
jgi:hypothetical protein